MRPRRDSLSVMPQSDRTFALEGGFSGSLVIGIAMALVIEGVAIHVWIEGGSQAWAWAITALNVATLVWLWRAYQARTRSALAIGTHDVEVTVGNQLECRFARSAIASADVATWRSVPDVASDFINAAKPLE